jgi:hypothetical protein
MGFRARSLWIAMAAVVYVAYAAMHATEGGPIGAAMIVVLPLALVWAFRATAPPVRGEDRLDDTARAGARAAFTGAAITIAAIAGTGSSAFIAAENFGVGLASVGALVAFARVGSLGGVLAPANEARRLDAAAALALLFAIAVALPLARAVAPRGEGLDPALVQVATTAAALAALGLFLVSSLAIRVRRRLELGLSDRAGAAFWLAFTLLLIGVASAATGVSSAERLLPPTAAVAAVAISLSAVAREPTTLARGLRVFVVLAAIVTPVALYAAYVARVAGPKSAPLVALACAIAAFASLGAPLVAHRLLAPAAGRWLDALDAATRAAMTPDPDAALEAALLAMRGATGQRGTDPAFYHLGVPEVVRVDRAGYVHREKGEPPTRLVDLADEEPERVLRREVLDAVTVRRPEVRPLSLWLEERGYAAVAIIRDEQGPVALLTVPAGARKRPWTLEEVRALRALADRLGAVVGASAQLSRSRMREVELRGELAKVRAEADTLNRAAEQDADRRRASAKLLARAADVAAYSPAVQDARQQLERLAASDHPVVLLSAPGIDAIAWAAAAHLASGRRASPLAIVDATSQNEHDLEHWRDAAISPLGAAARGTLVIVDAHALPLPVQSYIAAALPDGAGLVVSLPRTVDTLVADGALSEAFADRLGARSVALPTLAARPEDLRALALDTLGRIGVRLHREPLGLDPQALAALLEHTWPGNDAELYATLLRAALVAEPPAIAARDLVRIGFVSPVESEPPRRSAFPSARPVKKRGG